MVIGRSSFYLNQDDAKVPIVHQFEVKSVGKFPEGVIGCYLADNAVVTDTSVPPKLILIAPSFCVSRSCTPKLCIC